MHAIKLGQSLLITNSRITLLASLKGSAFALLLGVLQCIRPIDGEERLATLMLLNQTAIGLAANSFEPSCVPINGICELNLSGSVTALAGSGTSGFLDGSGTIAQFFSPIGLASDGTNLFVADCSNNRIRKIVIATGITMTLAGSGVAGSADGTGTGAELNCPSGLATDGTTLYVADATNHSIRMIAINTGVVTTLAGSGGVGFQDGTTGGAKFNVPSGVALKGGYLYVADSGNHSIRRISLPGGPVTTVAGSVTSGFLNGMGPAARFYIPYGVATDGINLYVADSGNDSVRMISLFGWRRDYACRFGYWRIPRCNWNCGTIRRTLWTGVRWRCSVCCGLL